MPGARIANPQHGISLGGLSLTSAGKPVDNADGFTVEVSADGTTWGNPEVAVSSLISELSGGDLVSQTRTGNREPVLYVRISSDTHDGLVAGDTALSRVVGDPQELVWQPPDVLAPPTVIDVVWSKMEHQWDDMDSARRQRCWVVTMAALPWPRSAGLVVTPAVATAAGTTVNAGSSTTGWSSSNGTVSVVSGAVVSSYNGAVAYQAATPYSIAQYGTHLELAGTVNTATEHYVGIDWKSSAPVVQFFTGTPAVSGQNSEVRRDPLPGGYVRSWYRIEGNSIGAPRLKVLQSGPVSGTQTLSIDQVIKAATLPLLGTGRELTRTIDPDGNVPAEGTVIVQHATAGLGQAIVFSHPIQSGYSPSMRQWRVASSTVSVDALSVSGSVNPLDTTMSFVIPAASIPTGDVHFWARILRQTTGAGTITGGAFSAAGAGAYVGDAQLFGVNQNYSANVWKLVPITLLDLPPTTIGVGGFVQIDIIGTGLFFDQGWLFAMDKGHLTIVECGGIAGSSTPAVGTVSNRLRIDAASLAAPHGATLTGVAADWSNAHTPPSSTVPCPQTGHRFDPDGSMVHVVTAGITSGTEASVSFEHFPRWRAEAAS